MTLRTRVVVVAVAAVLAAGPVHAQTQPPEPVPAPVGADPVVATEAVLVADAEAALAAETHRANVAAARVELEETEATLRVARGRAEAAGVAVTEAAAVLDQTESELEQVRRLVGFAAVGSLIGSTGQGFTLSGEVPDWMAREAVAPLVLGDLQTRFDAAQQRVDKAGQDLRRLVRVRDRALIAVTETEALRDGAADRVHALEGVVVPTGAGAKGPLLLGDPVVSATEMAGWFRQTRPFAALTMTPPVEELAALYISEGATEGVRGDLAFVQAVIETGGFRSSHWRQRWNTSGIGAYDSCSPTCSFGFESAQLGVRAQIQLLRTYATPGLTTAMLVNPPDPRLVPERSSVRGCCPSLTDLAGVWATDRTYGVKLLRLYGSLLEYSLNQPEGSADGEAQVEENVDGVAGV